MSLQTSVVGFAHAPIHSLIVLLTRVRCSTFVERNSIHVEQSGGWARGFVTNSRPSGWPWSLQHTTVRSRTAHHGDRRPPPGPGRCTRRTTLHGARTHLTRRRRERPGLLPEPGPQRSDRTVRHSSGEALSVALATISEVVDSSALSWLADRVLNEQRWDQDVEGLRHLQERSARMVVVVQKQYEERAAWLASRREGGGRRSCSRFFFLVLFLPAQLALGDLDTTLFVRCLRLSSSVSGCCPSSTPCGPSSVRQWTQFMHQSSLAVWLFHTSSTRSWTSALEIDPRTRVWCLRRQRNTGLLHLGDDFKKGLGFGAVGWLDSGFMVIRRFTGLITNFTHFQRAGGFWETASE